MTVFSSLNSSQLHFMHSMMQHISLQQTCTGSLRLCCLQLIFPKSEAEKEEYGQQSPARSFRDSILLLFSLLLLHRIVHALLSWTYWSTALCREMPSLSLVGHMILFLHLSLYHFLELILCLSGSLGAILCHCHWLVMSLQAGWGLSKCLLRGGWHLLSRVNWGFRKLVPSAPFWSGNRRNESFFMSGFAPAVSDGCCSPTCFH